MECALPPLLWLQLLELTPRGVKSFLLHIPVTDQLCNKTQSLGMASGLCRTALPLGGNGLLPGLGTSHVAHLAELRKLSSCVDVSQPGLRGQELVVGRVKLGQIHSNSDGALGLQEVAGRTRWVA